MYSDKMKTRRKFLQQLAGLPLIGSAAAFPDVGSLFGGGVKPRLRRADYDAARSPMVEWETVHDPYEPDEVNGFVEGLATEKVLPVIRPISVWVIKQPWKEFGRGMPDFPRTGIYFDFEIMVSLLRLPRYGRNADGTRRLRHSRSYLTDSMRAKDEPNVLPACAVTLDHREIRLVTEKGVYKPDSELWHSSSHAHGFVGMQGVYDMKDGSEVGYYRPPVPTCSRRDFTFNPDIDFIMRFDTARESPQRFHLILPPITIQGTPVPLPVLYFEPYDDSREKWLD